MNATEPAGAATDAGRAAGADGHPHGAGGAGLAALCVTALGVVFGDIGTSPLYAIRECFEGPHAVQVGHENVLGVLSLIFWSLVVVISVKYLAIVLRADNHGEGGILALTALVIPARGRLSERGWWVVGLGLFGAALLYGDGVITPAISVLSAVEGLGVVTPVFEPYIVPITIAILVALFSIQSRGTAGVGKVFGPITLVWFITLGVLGVPHILQRPDVLGAVNPVHAATFFAANGWTGFVLLGTVFLVVTGGEALYADMGHFGPRPIRVSWFVVVLPALLLNYFGQGALLLVDADATEHPFFHLAPEWALVPLVLLATAATVIASQALISGAFSLTMQAVQLGFSPRLDIHHTSAETRGQIYIPDVNWMLMLACVAVVLGFRSSSSLAAAYGIAVTSTMVITTMLLYVVARHRWKWGKARALAVCVPFLVIDGAFFGANLTKVVQGGWLPLSLAAILFVLMSTWKRGRELLSDRLRRRMGSLRTFLAEIEVAPPMRVPGTAVFLFSNPQGVPPALQRNLEHNHVLHRRNIIVHIITADVPRVPADRRAEVEEIAHDFYRVRLRYGFMETPNVPEALRLLPEPRIIPEAVSYFLGRETLAATPTPGLALWRENLFVIMARNARSASDYFGLPPSQVVELGETVEL